VRRVLVYALPAVLALAIGVAVANRFAGPLPPRALSISTGRQGGAYHDFALEYRTLLARDGFTLEIRPSAGSIETLERLARREVDAGFAQGGTAAGRDVTGLSSLGAVFLEPVWVFHRAALKVGTLADLRGRRVAVGEQGSGARELALQLLADIGVEAGNTTLLEVGGEDAATGLSAGSLDAAFFVMSARAPLVQRLVREPDLGLLHERRHLAYAGRYPYLTAVQLGEGMLDLSANIPSANIRLLAVAASLVVRNDLHPDHVRVLLRAAEQVHRGKGRFEEEVRLPAAMLAELPLHDDARRYFRDGPSWLERRLPFRIAGLVDRLVLILLPVMAILPVFFGAVLPLLERRGRNRILSFYPRLRELEREADFLPGEAVEEEIARLLAIDHEVMEHHVADRFLCDLYHLRAHIALVLARLEARRQALASEGREWARRPAVEPAPLGPTRTDRAP
jgi:TRAP transporter TAXI family solute receptor